MDIEQTILLASHNAVIVYFWVDRRAAIIIILMDVQEIVKLMSIMIATLLRGKVQSAILVIYKYSINIA